jgi:hypothetical protein
LPTSGTEEVEVKTFGKVTAQRHACEVVCSNVIARDGYSLKLSALVVPYICGTIVKPSIEDILGRYPHLAPLDLADRTSSEPMAVDVLIGADQYWSLVSGRVVQGRQAL